MIGPTPPAVRTIRAVTLYAPLGRGIVEYAARLQPAGEVASSLPPHPSSWFVTHHLGGIAGGTYTEVAIEPDAGNAAPLPVCSCCSMRVLRPVGSGLACRDCDLTGAPSEPPPRGTRGRV